MTLSDLDGAVKSGASSAVIMIERDGNTFIVSLKAEKDD